MVRRDRKQAFSKAHAGRRSPQKPARTLVNTRTYEKKFQLHEQLGKCIGGGRLTMYRLASRAYEHWCGLLRGFKERRSVGMPREMAF